MNRRWILMPSVGASNARRAAGRRARRATGTGGPGGNNRKPDGSENKLRLQVETAEMPTVSASSGPRRTAPSVQVREFFKRFAPPSDQTKASTRKAQADDL